MEMWPCCGLSHSLGLFPDHCTEEDYNLETLLESDDSELSQDQRTLCINVSIVDDVEFEGLHQFSIELQLNTSQPQVAVSPNTITVNIADNEGMFPLNTINLCLAILILF